MTTILAKDLKNGDRFLLGGREFEVSLLKQVKGKHHQNDHVEFFGRDVETQHGATLAFDNELKFRIKE